MRTLIIHNLERINNTQSLINLFSNFKSENFIYDKNIVYPLLNDEDFFENNKEEINKKLEENAKTQIHLSGDEKISSILKLFNSEKDNFHYYYFLRAGELSNELLNNLDDKSNVILVIASPYISMLSCETIERINDSLYSFYDFLSYPEDLQILKIDIDSISKNNFINIENNELFKLNLKFFDIILNNIDTANDLLQNLYLNKENKINIFEKYNFKLLSKFSFKKILTDEKNN